MRTSQGSGPAVLLLHGFGADPAPIGSVGRHRRADGGPTSSPPTPAPWRSDKPHTPTGTAATRLARGRSDRLGVEQVDVVGPDGLVFAARLVPEPRPAPFSAVGATVPPRSGATSEQLTALLADDPASIERRREGLPQFADFTGAAAAPPALSQSGTLRYSVRFDAITVPTLVVAGADDRLIRSPNELADRCRPPVSDRGGVLSGFRTTPFHAGIVEFRGGAPMTAAVARVDRRRDGPRPRDPSIGRRGGGQKVDVKFEELRVSTPGDARQKTRSGFSGPGGARRTSRPVPAFPPAQPISSRWRRTSSASRRAGRSGRSSAARTSSRTTRC
jgi:hypothetical protein